MAGVLLQIGNPSNAAEAGIAIHGDAVANGSHHLFLMVDAANENPVPPHRAPFGQLGTLEGQAVQIELLRIGYDGLRGYLTRGLAGYVATGFPTASTPRLSMAEVRRVMEKGTPLTVLDVRNPGEAAEAHVPGAINIPLPRLEKEAASTLAQDLPLFVHCQSGYRAGIATSLLERMGFSDVGHVTDGPERWKPKSARIPRARASH